MPKLYKPASAAPLLYNATKNTLGVHPSRVNVLCRTGRLGQRLGGGWVISEEDITRYNDGNEGLEQEEKTEVVQ